MGYTALVASDLTPGLIEAGEKLIRNLDAAKTPVPAAFWLLTEDSGWRLTIASPKVTETGSRQFYSTLNAQLRTLGHRELNITHITAVRPDDPTVSLLRTAMRTGQDLSRIRFTGNVINGRLIPDALIYRLM
ncbi:MAG: hypothetical protein ACT4P3_10460 [Betaproteobacteria bacterium]